MDFLSKKTLILAIAGVLIFILEISVILNSYVTMKYKIEDDVSSTDAINNFYSLIQLLSISLLVNLLIIIFLLVIIARS
ncbi:hypothetical protein HYE59_07700 [Aggregatibacter actinomycetemcomitans]|uniref:hypothetical protein n=1 Tax=Aggregatibacter actinomycetemcomitans TaxID=714 RepID=UPI00197BD7D9|nr:hypothetical protein [Aggregatibacter actinomycetemcomitans]MBN6073939.1 hypothetical protein [Aggregatibacter actinomycetemcomitans]MBN6077415.1 hypothetical protein [Aggregatibacter actinomycetemcomitans]